MSATVLQLPLIEPTPAAAPRWSLEGSACPRCAEGRMYLVVASDPCACVEQLCICLAEGYAKCDGCGELRQVWPREIVTAWRSTSHR